MFVFVIFYGKMLGQGYKHVQLQNVVKRNLKQSKILKNIKRDKIIISDINLRL